MKMVFYPNPNYKGRNYIWTDDANRHLRDRPNGGRYMWVVPVLVHEFAHTFGLRHSGFGIMNPDDVFDEDVAIATIQPADVAAIRQAPLPDRRFIWIDSAIAHEMGHAFGLKDHHGNPRYDGIMDVNDTLFMGTDSIKQADKDVLIQAYTSHTINEGW